jgi:hypothetical protein
MSAKERSVLMRALKSGLATAIGEILMAIQGGQTITADNYKQLVVLPLLVALGMALEKWLLWVPDPETEVKP